MFQLLQVIAFKLRIMKLNLEFAKSRFFTPKIILIFLKSQMNELNMMNTLRTHKLS